MKYLLLTVVPFLFNNKRSRSILDNFINGLAEGYNSTKQEEQVHRHFLPLSSDTIEDEADPVLH